MKPTEFPEQNRVWAKDQPPYLPLPAYSDGEQTVTCWALSWADRLRMLLTGRLWLSQLNFGQALQPQKPSASSPFRAEPKEGE